MPRKPDTYENGGYYHVFNRGCDKRPISLDVKDTKRILKSFALFNTVSPAISIFNTDGRRQYAVTKRNNTRLVTIVAYCVLPNHFHLILQQKVEGGVSEFMKRLGGYTSYFNKRHKRTGVLFQGKYKSKHIKTTEYFLHLSVYVHLNYKVHPKYAEKKRDPRIATSYDSLGLPHGDGFSDPKEILRHYKSVGEYKIQAEETLRNIQSRKIAIHDFDHE